MNEIKRKLEFFNEFIDIVEAKGRVSGSRQTPFLQEVLPFINDDDEPVISYFKKQDLNIQLNGYMYQDHTNTLNLYIVDYDPFLKEENELPVVNMTYLKEVANKAKRFYTSAESIFQLTDRSMESYDITKLIIDKKNIIEEINIYVLTSKFYVSNKPIDLIIPNIETVNIHVWDMDRIFKLSEAEQGIREFDIHFESEYGEAIQMMHVPNNSENELIDCYIGFIPARLLAKLYDDWGPKLVERNVRSFLQARGGTNKGIRDTLKDKKQRELFISYNNGISSVAKAGDIEQIKDSSLYKIKTLTSWQIVNGGQTTASIHQAYKNNIDLEGVYVQSKLTILNMLNEKENDLQLDHHALEDEMIAKISEYANTQNKINKSDLLANTRFMSDIEKFSRNIWIPTQDNRKEESKWYFERARGQYMVDISRRSKGKEQNAFKKVYPKENVITKVEMAKYFMSWEGYPHVSSKGGEEAFKRFMDLNSVYWKKSTLENDNNEVRNGILSIDSDYYKQLIARRIINSFVTNLVESMNLKGYKANVIYYTVAMLSYIYREEIDLMEIWEKQFISDKWEYIVRVIATSALNYIRESAGDQNVTQWARKEECWKGFIEESAITLSGMN